MQDTLSEKEYEEPFKGQPVLGTPLKGNDESRVQWLEQSESQRLIAAEQTARWTGDDYAKRNTEQEIYKGVQVDGRRAHDARESQLS